MSKYERTRGYFPRTTYSGVIMETPGQRGGGPTVAGAQLFSTNKDGDPTYQEVQLTYWRNELPAQGTVVKIYGEPIVASRNGPERPYVDLEFNVQKIAECPVPDSHTGSPPPALRRQRAPGGDTAPVASPAFVAPATDFAQDPNKVEDW